MCYIQKRKKEEQEEREKQCVMAGWLSIFKVNVINRTSRYFLTYPDYLLPQVFVKVINICNFESQVHDLGDNNSINICEVCVLC